MNAEELNKHISGRLVEIRKRNGHPQKVVADQLGVTYQQVQKYESGRCALSAAKVYQFAKENGVEVQSMFPMADEDKPTRAAIDDDFAAAFMNMLAIRINDANREKGFWEGERNVGELLALVHSEVSEALEAHRKDLNDSHLKHRKGIEVELADALIRILDMAAGLQMDIGNAMIEKLAFNAKRPQKHGKKY